MGKKEKTHQAEKIKEKLSLLERSTAHETEQRLQNALFLCLFKKKKLNYLRYHQNARVCLLVLLAW